MEIHKLWPIRLLFHHNSTRDCGLRQLGSVFLDALMENYKNVFYLVEMYLEFDGNDLEMVQKGITFHTKSKDPFALSLTDKVNRREGKIVDYTDYAVFTIMVTKEVYRSIYYYISNLEDSIPFQNRKLNEIYYILSKQFSCFNPTNKWDKIDKQVKTTESEHVITLEDNLEDFNDKRPISTISLGEGEIHEEIETDIDNEDGMEYNSVHIGLKSSFSSEIICIILQNNLKIVMNLIPEKTSPSMLWKALEVYHNTEGKDVTQITD